MLLLSVLLVPIVLATDSQLNIDNYALKINDNILENIQQIGGRSTELNLSSLGLRGIGNKNVFDDLHHVKFLNLANNSLSKLPEFVFSSLANLEYLTLADNKIEEFQNAFVGLNNLKTLNITNNPIRYLKESFFFGLNKSSDIITLDNAFVSLSADLFANPFLRTRPEQSASQLRDGGKNKDTKDAESSTSEDIEIEDLESLKTLFDRNLMIKICIHEGTVKSLRNSKDEVPENGCSRVVVDNTISLVTVYMNKLGIKNFEKGWYQLKDLPDQSLEFNGNNIARVTRELLNDLTENVTHVSLSGNKIERLEKGIIENNYLKSLNFMDNLISAIDEGAFEKTNLTALYVAGNKLKDTKFVATLPTALTALVLYNNTINEISDSSFSKLSKLLYLNLEDNNITELRIESLRGLSSMDTLDLENNHVNKIAPNSFQDLESLRFLQLTNNDLTILEKGMFAGLSKIERIYMSKNKVKKIEKESLRDLPDSLRELILYSNELETIESGTFVNVPNHLLSLDANKITKIEKGAFDLPTLKHLRLARNSLNNLDGDMFEGLKTLRHLYLWDNRIAKIVKGTTKNLGSLYTFDISGNPIGSLDNGALYGLQKSQGTYVRLSGQFVKVIQGGVFDDV